MMSTFPPKAGAQVTLANWRTAPFNVWAFHHVREIIPTADITNDPRHVMPLLPGAGGLGELSFDGADGKRRTLDAFLAETNTDGFVVLHRGRVLAERYFNGLNADTPHILMSVSKSMLGLLSGALVEQGSLNLDRLVTAYVPEVSGTAYDGATVRQLLDMRVGISFDEDYLAAGGNIVAYRKATNWNPLEPGDVASDLRSFYGCLTAKDGAHGGRFHYVSPNTDLLGWVIERATGRRYADLMSDLIWKPMGAGRNGYITVDRLGAPRCAGGMCVTIADLARVGQLLVSRGRSGDRQVVPASWIDDITRNGDSDAWAKGDFYDFFGRSQYHYRSKWYVQPAADPLLFGLGIHGQNLFVDPARELVIAKVSSQVLPLDQSRNDLTMRAVAAIRQALG